MQMTGTGPGLSHPAREHTPQLAHDNSGTGERDSGSNKSTLLSYDIGDKEWFLLQQALLKVLGL